MTADNRHSVESGFLPTTPGSKVEFTSDGRVLIDDVEVEGRYEPRLFEAIARAFHEAYERLAPAFGYKTREASAWAWEEIPEVNRKVMIAVVTDLMENDIIEPGGRA